MSRLQGKSVLIVEDSANVRNQLKELYTSLGMNVTAEAENGVIALGLMESTDFDLVSLDIIMPEMNGIECYQEIVNVKPSQHCVFFTYLAGDPMVMENLKKIIPAEIIFQKKFELESISPRLEQIMSVDAKILLINRDAASPDAA